MKQIEGLMKQIEGLMKEIEDSINWNKKMK